MTHDSLQRNVEVSNLPPSWLTQHLLRNTLVLGGTGYDRLGAFKYFWRDVLRVHGGGFFMSPYANMDTFNDIRHLCRSHGREDDLILLDLRSRQAPNTASSLDPKIVKMRFNPFVDMDHEQLSELIVSMMDMGDESSTMWQGRAIAMLNGVIQSLAWLRDHHGFILSPQVLSDHMSLGQITQLYEDERIPGEVKNSITNYLNGLPGFDPQRGLKQSSTTRDQHGYLAMQFTKLINFLQREVGAEKSDRQDISFKKVIDNKRIVVALIPEIEFGKSSKASFGSVVARALVFAMQDQLRPLGDGGATRKPPFVCMFDKHYGALSEIEMMAAFGRACGVGVIYADDSLSHLMCVDERAAAALTANTGTKLICRSDDQKTRSLLSIDEDPVHLPHNVGYLVRDRGVTTIEWREYAMPGL